MTKMDRRAFLEMTAAASALAAMRGATPSAAAQAAAGGGLKKAVYVSHAPQGAGLPGQVQAGASTSGSRASRSARSPTTPWPPRSRRRRRRPASRSTRCMNADHWRYPLSSADPEVVNKSVAGMETSLRNAKLWGADAVLLVPGRRERRHVVQGRLDAIAEGHQGADPAAGAGTQGRRRAWRRSGTSS